jgi:hypothetical protein
MEKKNEERNKYFWWKTVLMITQMQSQVEGSTKMKTIEAILQSIIKQ